MYTAKILDAGKETYANGEEFIDVEIGVFVKEKGKEKQIDVRKFAFPITDSDKDIKAKVKKFIDLYNVEAEMAIEDGKKQEKNKKIDETISKLKGESK